MMRSSRMGGGRVLRAASQVVSGKEAVSVGASQVVSGKEAVLVGATGNSAARGGGADLRTVSIPSTLPSAGATSPTYAGGAATWSDWETVYPDKEREEGEVDEEELKEFWFLETAPRAEEVEAAILSLQEMSIPSRFTQGGLDAYNNDENSNSNTPEGETASVPRTSASTEQESDWIEPTFHACNELSASNNSQKALEAFHLLKVNPLIQKMVFSLSSDDAVWAAVMNNEAVQEIKKSLCEEIADAKTKDHRGPVERMVSALGSIYSNTKNTVVELIEKVTTFVNNLVHSSEKKGNGESEFFADAVKSSLMLSVFVFLIVIVGRLQK